MYFRIVAQRFEVSHPFYRIGNGFLIYNISFIKIHGHPKTIQNQFFQNLNLHLTHELHFDLPQFLIPSNMKFRFLVFQKTQFSKKLHRITVSWQRQLIIQYRLQHREIGVMFGSKPFSGPRLRKSCYRADHPRFRLIHRLIFGSGIDTDLIYFFLPLFFLRRSGQGIFYFERSSGHPKPGQSSSLLIPADLKNPRAEFLLRLFYIRILLQASQKFIHPVELQR